MSSPGEEVSSSSGHLSLSTPQTMDPSAILIKVLSPAENFPTDLAFRVLPKSTVGELKSSISATLDSRPANDQQRLIYRGKMLTDELVIETILGLGPGKDGGAGETPQDAYTFHLVIRPSINSPTSPSPPSNPFLSSNPYSNTSPPLPSSSPSPPGSGPTTTTTTTSTITPTSSSSIVTTTTRITTTSVVPRNNGAPSIPGIGGAPNFAAMSFDELRQTLRQRAQATEQQQDNLAARQRLTEDLARMNEVLGQRITTARQSVNAGVDVSGRSTSISVPGFGTSGSDSISRTQAIRYGPGGIPVPSTGVPTPVASGSGTVTSSSGGFTRAPMSEQMNQILEIEDEARRRALLELQQEEAEQRSETTSFTATSPIRNPLADVYPSVQPTNNNLLGGNNLIYILQDASGMPTALLVGPPGSAGPPVPAPAPIANINWAAGGLADIPADLRALGWPVPDNLNFGAHVHNRFQNGGFGFQDHQARAAVNRNRPINLGDILAGFRARATHFWLAVRLAVFVVLFTGSGGWRRMLYLGSIAVLIFIWQTGIFNEFFRPFLEAINPPVPNPNPIPAAGAAGPNPELNQPQTPQQPLTRDGNGNPIGPAHTAEMLVARHEDRIRNMIRGVERGITIFLASLVPGLHERHVDAVEARQREAQQLRDAQEAANAEAAGGVAAEGQEPARDAQEGAGVVPPQVPVVEAEPEVIRGLL